MILPILTVDSQKNIEFLRRKCAPITAFDESLEALVRDMTETMLVVENGGPRGVGLAAPQIGKDINLFVMMTPAGIENRTFETVAMINPVLTIGNKETYPDMEGCLSIPGLFGRVERHREILVTYQDTKEQTYQLALSGFPARVFQHEFDHLFGKLYTDIATEMYHKKAKL